MSRLPLPGSCIVTTRSAMLVTEMLQGCLHDAPSQHLESSTCISTLFFTPHDTRIIQFSTSLPPPRPLYASSKKPLALAIVYNHLSRQRLREA